MQLNLPAIGIGKVSEQRCRPACDGTGKRLLWQQRAVPSATFAPKMQSASMMRVLSLPAQFFKQYSAGELTSRVGNINSLCNMLCGVVLTTGLTSVFSLAYVTQIFRYAPALVIPALTFTLLTVLFSVAFTFVQIK